MHEFQDYLLCYFVFGLNDKFILRFCIFFVKMKTVFGIVVLAFAGNLLFVNCEEKKDDKDKKDVGTVIGIDLGTTYSW